MSFERIKKECFWDMNIDENEMLTMIHGDDARDKQLVFEKLLLNSTRLFHDLKLFDLSELKTLISQLKVPQFNKNHVLRRKNLVEVYFFDR